MKSKHVITFPVKLSLVLCLLASSSSLLCAQAKKNKKIKFQTSLEEAFKAPEMVTHLKLKGMDLDSIPPGFSVFENLMVLDLSKNNISEIDDEIFELPSLVELNLSKNLIVKIPNEVEKLDLLKRLIINQNPITTLPNSIAGCRSLEYIDAWGTEIIQLDSALTKAPKLTVIDLQSIRMGNNTQQAIVDQIKGRIKVKMSAPCNCD